MLARLTAILAREILGPVIDEWRRLEAGTGCDRPHADEATAGQVSLISGMTERATGWDHDQRQPVTAARCGFSLPGK